MKSTPKLPSIDPLGIPGYIDARLVNPGETAQVWKATQQRTNRKVAIKLLRSQDPVEIERFEKEIASLADLDTAPNIATLLDSDQRPSDGCPYIVFPWYSETLDDCLGQLDWEQTAKVGIGLCRALTAAHAAGVIHRDLKPPNVLVVRDHKGDPIPVLTDFGISKRANRKATSGLPRGTFPFIAPERFTAGVPGDERADVYALTGTLYVTLTGRLPLDYDGDINDLEDHHMIHLTLFGEAPRLPAGVAPDAFADLIAEGLAKNPADRPTITEFHERLEALLTAQAPAAAETLEHRDAEPGPALPAVVFQELDWAELPTIGGRPTTDGEPAGEWEMWDSEWASGEDMYDEPEGDEPDLNEKGSDTTPSDYSKPMIAVFAAVCLVLLLLGVAGTAELVRNPQRLWEWGHSSGQESSSTASSPNVTAVAGTVLPTTTSSTMSPDELDKLLYNAAANNTRLVSDKDSAVNIAFFKGPHDGDVCAIGVLTPGVMGHADLSIWQEPNLLAPIDAQGPSAKLAPVFGGDGGDGAVVFTGQGVTTEANPQCAPALCDDGTIRREHPDCKLSPTRRFVFRAANEDGTVAHQAVVDLGENRVAGLPDYEVFQSVMAHRTEDEMSPYYLPSAATAGAPSAGPDPTAPVPRSTPTAPSSSGASHTL